MKGKQQNVKRAKEELAEQSLSDHRMMFNTYNSWRNARDKKKFETENYIHRQNIQMIHGVRILIMRFLETAKYIDNTENYNVNSMNWEVVKSCLTAGLYRKL